MDNGSWISIHAYVMQHWVRVPMLISFQRVVDGTRVDNLTIIIMEALQKGRGFNYAFIVQKFLCFGANEVSTFQGTKIGVTKEIDINYAPLSIGVHCMAHKCNLAFKILSSLGIINNTKYLLQSCHSYFAHNPKWHLEFIKLIDMMETKGLKMFNKVKTQWISLLDPL